jgi:hypothetical protein
MLRKTLLAGVALSALGGSALAAGSSTMPVVAPTTPQEQTVQAHVDLYGGLFSLDLMGNDSGYIVGGAGRANVPLQNDWNLQVDAQGSAFGFTSGKGGWTNPEFGGYAHFYKRDPNSHALGIFGGAEFYSGPQLYTIGAEGQMYWPQFTLYGQASVSSFNCNGPCYSNLTMFQLRGEGQWFVNDNTVLLGDVIWRSFTGDDNFDMFTVAGTLMHRFNQGPISGFVTARWDGLGSGPTADQWTGLIGIRVHADPAGSTEKSHRHTGPAMDVVQPIEGGMLCWFAACGGNLQ